MVTWHVGLVATYLGASLKADACRYTQPRGTRVPARAACQCLVTLARRFLCGGRQAFAKLANSALSCDPDRCSLESPHHLATQTMKPSEVLATQAFAALDPKTRLRFVEDQSNTVYDFSLEAADGSIGALEVTSFHDVEMTRAHHAIRSQRHGGPVAPSRRVKQGWWIHPCTSANIRKVRDLADDYLAAIEAEGRVRFFYGTDGHKSRAVAAIYRDLRIDAGHVFHWKTPRQIRIALPGEGAIISTDSVLRMIRDVSNLSDNRTKLGASRCPRRVLFIEVDSNAYKQWVAVVRETPPSEAPELPPEVTELWVVARIASQVVVWRWYERAWTCEVV